MIFSVAAGNAVLSVDVFPRTSLHPSKDQEDLRSGLRCTAGEERLRQRKQHVQSPWGRNEFCAFVDGKRDSGRKGDQARQTGRGQII